MPTSENGQITDAKKDKSRDCNTPPCISDSNKRQPHGHSVNAFTVILLCVIAGLIAVFAYQTRQGNALRTEVARLSQQLEKSHADGNSLSQQLNTAHVEKKQLLQEMEELITSNRSSGLQRFPLIAQMEEAFQHGNYEQATRLAENLMFSYPSDAPSYLVLLTTYQSTVAKLIDSNQLLDGARLLNWMTGIQNRQAMVIKSDNAMEAYLSALESQRELMSRASTIANQDAKALEQRVQTQGAVWITPDMDEMTTEAAALVLVGAMLDSPNVSQIATAALEAIELLGIAAPSAHDSPERYLEYILALQSRQDSDEITYETVATLIAPRLTIAFDAFANILHAYAQSSENREWLWDRLHELHSLSADSTETFRVAVDSVKESLIIESESAITKAISDYREGRENTSDLMRLVERIGHLGVPATKINTFSLAMEKARAERQDAEIARKIVDIRNRLKLVNVDLDVMLAELALLPQPDTVRTMSELVSLTQEIQGAVAQKDRRDTEAKVRAYNRGALSELNELMKKMEYASRKERDDTRIDVAKKLSSMNESFLTRAMRDRYAEVYQESMKGLDEKQKLKVYEYWVSTVPKGLEDIQ